MSNTPEVYGRMAQALADLSYIPKGRSKGVSYEFRGIDAVMNVLHGVLAKNGLFPSPRVMDDWQVNLIPGTPDGKGNPRQQSQALFRVCVDMYAADGSCVTLGPGLAQSHDYGDKAVYQAQQNAIKYVLLEAFCIPTEEQDMDARMADDVPAQAAKPVDLAPLEAAIINAQDAGVQKTVGEWQLLRDYAAKSEQNLAKAMERVEAAVSEVAA
ncbi:MAG: ERF family protein [Intrasporangiaceae bacterium]|nr:ERF family protein [Intrasporangiaceae bacterium]